MSNGILWDMPPVWFKIGPLPFRPYGMLWALSFILGISIFRYLFEKEGRDDAQTVLDKLVPYMLLGTILGARIGHVLFYEPYTFVNRPWEAFLPIQSTPSGISFGFRGLASHGAIIGMGLALIATCYTLKYHLKWQLWPPRLTSIPKLDVKKMKFFYLVDRVVICGLLGAAFIRMGNFFNSEIYGRETSKPWGVVFLNGDGIGVKSALLETGLNANHENVLKSVEVKKRSSDEMRPSPYIPLDIKLLFKQTSSSQKELKFFLENNVKNILSHHYYVKEHIYEPDQTALQYRLTQNAEGQYEAHIMTHGIARHPAQLYEAISCLLLFLLLFMWWRLKRGRLKDGQLTGVFLICVFTLRFFYEFYKCTQIPFSSFSSLNTAQWLSIPAVGLGIIFLIYANFQSSFPPHEK